MNILRVDRKNSFFEVVPDNFDDLWHLEKLIAKGDLVSGGSDRKIKGRHEGDKAVKEKVFVELEAEKTEFHEATNQLRVMGVVTEARPPELVELGSHHTLEAEIGEKIRVKKKEIRNHEVERLERAKKASGREKLLLVVMDDEQADLAFLKDTGLDAKAKITAKRQGKRFGSWEKGKPYFEELLKKILGLEAEKIIIAGPGFEKQNFEKYLKDTSTKIRPAFETTNSVGVTGLNELLKSGKIDRLVEGYHSAEEAKAVERVLEGISSGLSAIGFAETAKAAELGAIEQLVVLEKMLSEEREKTEGIIDLAEQLKAKTIFVNPKSDAGKKLSGLGGIAAVLRYKALQTGAASRG